MRVMWPFRKVEEIDRDVHAELQHVNVVLSQLKSLIQRHEMSSDLYKGYSKAIIALLDLKIKLKEADAQPYEVDAG